MKIKVLIICLFIYIYKSYIYKNLVIFITCRVYKMKLKVLIICEL